CAHCPVTHRVHKTSSSARTAPAEGEHVARSARPARTTLVAAGAAAGALLLGACAPITTQLPYAPSDGSRVDFDDAAGLRGLNLMVLTAAEGEPGALLGALANQ